MEIYRTQIFSLDDKPVKFSYDIDESKVAPWPITLTINSSGMPFDTPAITIYLKTKDIAQLMNTLLSLDQVLTRKGIKL